jgi:hypothetical protein
MVGYRKGSSWCESIPQAAGRCLWRFPVPWRISKERFVNEKGDRVSPDVTASIENLEPWQAEIASNLRGMVHAAIPDGTERIQYKKPHFLKDGHYAAVMAPARGYVAFMIFNAQDLDAPDRFFEKQGPPERKTVKIKEGQEFDYDLLGKLVAQAAATL